MSHKEDRIFFQFDYPSLLKGSHIDLCCIKQFKDDYIIIGNYYYPNNNFSTLNFVYIGYLSGFGKWYPFSLQNKKYKNIKLESLSPCNICNDFIRISGNLEFNSKKQGFIYSGNFKSEGICELIIPFSLSSFEIDESNCKTINENYVAGTYKIKNFEVINSFLYNIENKKYYDINYENENCKTIVNCMIKNSKYITFCGNLIYSNQEVYGYISFWNIKNNKMESWYKYQYSDKEKNYETQFNSISFVGNKFNIIGEYINNKNENKKIIAKIKKNSKHKLNEEIKWYEFDIENNTNLNIRKCKANSICKDIIIGNYKTEGSEETKGYISILK